MRKEITCDFKTNLAVSECVQTWGTNPKIIFSGWKNARIDVN